MAQTFTYFMPPVEFESVSQVTATNSVDLGTIRVQGGAEWVYVYNAGAANAPVGTVMALSFNSGYSVTVSTTTGYDIAFGAVVNTAISNGQYGWLMTRGFCTLTNGMNTTALAAGDLLVPAAAGKVQNLKVAVTALSGSDNGVIGLPAFGYVVSACASGGAANSQCAAYVRCWGS